VLRKIDVLLTYLLTTSRSRSFSLAENQMVTIKPGIKQEYQGVPERTISADGAIAVVVRFGDVLGDGKRTKETV